MSELVAEVKTLIVQMKCEKCGKGLMEPFGDTVLATYPQQYPHKCNKCGNVENYPVEYPYMRYVPIEPLRDSTGKSFYARCKSSPTL